MSAAVESAARAPRNYRLRSAVKVRRITDAATSRTAAVMIASLRTPRCTAAVIGSMRLPYAAANIVDATRIVFNGPSPELRRVGLTKVDDAYIARLLPKDDSRPLFARAHRRTRSRGASYVSRLGNGGSGRRSGCAERRARGRLFPDAHETIGRSVGQERSEPRSGVRPRLRQIRATTDELTESSNDRFWQAVRTGVCSRRTVAAG